MPNLDEPAAALFLVAAVLAVLLAMGRGALSERQKTAAWAVLTLLFFSLGSVFFRGHARRQSPDESRATAVISLQ
jgi:hypothetical protein